MPDVGRTQEEFEHHELQASDLRILCGILLLYNNKIGGHANFPWVYWHNEP